MVGSALICEINAPRSTQETHPKLLEEHLGAERAALIKKLARELRYRSLPDLVGCEITINSLASVQADIRAALGDALPSGCKFVESDAKNIEVPLAKYGLIDITLIAPPDVLDSSRRAGARLLRELGFIDGPVSQDVRENRDVTVPDPTCLELLAEGVNKEESLIKLFLSSIPQSDLKQHFLNLLIKKQEHGWDAAFKLPERFFPRAFQLEDACITNADSVWFHKHFYL